MVLTTPLLASSLSLSPFLSSSSLLLPLPPIRTVLESSVTATKLANSFLSHPPLGSSGTMQIDAESILSW